MVKWEGPKAIMKHCRGILHILQHIIVSYIVETNTYIQTKLSKTTIRSNLGNKKIMKNKSISNHYNHFKHHFNDRINETTPATFPNYLSHPLSRKTKEFNSYVLRPKQLLWRLCLPFSSVGRRKTGSLQQQLKLLIFSPLG